MLDMVNGGKTPDNEVIFYDGFLYIISCEKEPEIFGGEYHDAEYSVDVKCLDGVYEEPITLADITERYPNVSKVIYDDALKGYVYNYGNHRFEKDSEMWELVGTTLGYA